MKPLRWVALAVALGIGPLIGPRSAAADPSPAPAATPRVTLEVSEPPHFASADSVKATLSLENPTPSDITYDRFAIAFLVRGDDGKVVERRKRMFYSVAPKPARLGAGQTASFDIFLPVCDAKGAACTMRVAVKLPVVVDGEHVDLTSAERSYAIVSDPAR